MGTPFNARHAWLALAASAHCQVQELPTTAAWLAPLLRITRGGVSIHYDPHSAEWWDERDPEHCLHGYHRACRYLGLPQEPAIAATVGS